MTVLILAASDSVSVVCSVIVAEAEDAALLQKCKQILKTTVEINI